MNCEVIGCEVTAGTENEFEWGKKIRCAHIQLHLTLCNQQKCSKIWVNISTTEITLRQCHYIHGYSWMVGCFCQKVQMV